MSSEIKRHSRLLLVLVPFVAVSILAIVFPPVRATALRLLGLLGYYALCIMLARHTAAHRELSKLSPATFAAVLGLSVVVTCVVAWYLSTYDFIPYWDGQGYWVGTLSFNQRLSEHPVATITSIYESINTSDYNDLQSWVMSLPVWLFPSWKGTFLVEFVTMSIPTALLASLTSVGFARESLGGSKRPVRIDLAVVSCFAIFLLSPVMLRPVLSGYLDEVGVLLLVSTIAATFEPSLTYRPGKCVALGMALCVLLLLRRWFVYAVVGLGVSAVVWWLAHVFLCRRSALLASLRGVAKSLALVLVGTLLPMLTLFRGYVLRSMGGNYAEMYSSWAWADSLGARLLDVASHFGWGWIALFVVACALALLQTVRRGWSNERRLPAAPVLVLGALAAALLFWRTQDLSPQHWYIFAPYLIIALLECIVCLAAALERMPSTALCASAFVAAVLTLAHGLGIFAADSELLSRVCGMHMVSPIVQTGVEEREELVSYLDRVTDPGDIVYFAAASIEVNYTIAVGVVAPEATVAPFACAFADVDSRDGFNPALFDAKYVVATQPTQLHLKAENEQVVVRVNEMIQDGGSCIGRHYALEETFDLHDGIVVLLYRKKSDYTAEDIRELRDMFVGLYPQWPELFADRFDVRG